MKQASGEWRMGRWFSRWGTRVQRLTVLLVVVVVLLGLGVVSLVGSKGAPASRTEAGPSGISVVLPTLTSQQQLTVRPPVSSPTPYSGDPVMALPVPANPRAANFYTETGHYLGADFVAYYKATPNAADLFGLPLTEEFPQQLDGAGTYQVQYFERARLELHPELTIGQRVQLGLLAPAMLKGRSFGPLPTLPSTTTRQYFPETGHTLSNGFLNYWKANGGVRVFGLPLSEEMGEDGVTVQYLERARFEYDAGLEGTPYAVQLSPIGYYALRETKYNVPMGTLVRFDPPRVAEGHTAVVEVAASVGVTVSGQYEGRPLAFTYEAERGIAWAMLGAVAFSDVGAHNVTISLKNGDGGKRTVTRTLEVTSYSFPAEVLQFDPETASLLDPALLAQEKTTLDTIFAGRTPQQYWDGTFRMPLDGRIRMTSAFATRRCYQCAPGSPPTTYHGGMDMAANEGTPVHATAGGVVVFAGKLAERGNAIIIDHGLGVYSLFAHNSKLIAQVGQKVKQGDVVSLSGNTGLSNGPHLHWEVHVSGPPVEPLEWVNRAMP